MPRRWGGARTVGKPYAPKKVTVDGVTFDSATEAGRAGELKLLQMAGHVRGLAFHPRLDMIVNGRKIGRGFIVLDFRYEEWKDGAWRLVYEDCKPVITREAKVRLQVAEAIHGITIKLTKGSR